ncbi:hypothetical protein ACWDWO_16380 [Actinopolymorpha singaporensis]|uniref:Uncharacterized protein n=1 Tax=Actinopolymorpha singaporensis TaxID=117157 RepID=A0A1H1RZC5_9ACTN|nr:hypothetical protein [Actinopolymorpha singaporensis]SDS40329.1 hypothetical protein SAMN04489717_2585 [Actinopolymorpha singaporensis]
MPNPRIPRRTLLLAGAAAVVVVPAVGVTTAAAGDARDRARSARHYPELGLDLVPAPAGTVPTLSASAAVHAYEHRQGRATWQPPRRPRTEVMLASTTGSVDLRGPGEPPAGPLDNRLVWVLTWRDVDAEVHGPATLSRAEREAVRQRLRFDGTAVVDATTGEVLVVFEEGHDRGRPV